MSDFVIVEDLFTPSQIEQILAKVTETVHHDDDGHHVSTSKPNHLLEVAMTITDLMGIGGYGVDPNCKLYRLNPTSSAIAPHRDTDFVTPSGFLADWSVLVYLTDAYEGGETIFDGVTVCPHLRAGSVLMFPHNLLHEGRPVLSGEKIVLKTDLLRMA